MTQLRSAKPSQALAPTVAQDLLLRLCPCRALVPPSNEGGMAEPVQEGSMPPWYDTLLHPTARLSLVETQTLIKALAAWRQDDEGEVEGRR